LIKYQFKWSCQLKIKDPDVKKVLSMMGPRLVSMLFIQLIFLVHDNLASRLASGAISALTYGWLIMQVPETLIGTAIATALLPTLSEKVANEQFTELKDQILKTIRVMIAITIPISVILGLGLLPLVQLAFNFTAEETSLVMFTTRAFLIGVAGHSLVELLVRSFYARQNARIPMLTTAGTSLLFVILAIILYKRLDAAGIALSNSIAFTLQAVVLMILLGKNLGANLSPGMTMIRALLSGLLGGVVVWVLMNKLPLSLPEWIMAIIAMAIGLLCALIPIRRELRELVHL